MSGWKAISPNASIEAASLLKTVAHCCSVRPAALLEVAAFCGRRKPALRLVLDEPDAVALKTAASLLGIGVADTRIGLQHRGNSWSNVVSAEADAEATLLVLSREFPASDLLKAEQENAADAGALLGYPDCCVKAITELNIAGPSWSLVLLRHHNFGTPVDARLNRFAAECGRIGLIGEMFPCSLSCAKAKAYAQMLYETTIELGLSRLAQQARIDALSPVRISGHGEVVAASFDDATAIHFTDWS